MKKTGYLLYLILVFGICLTPLLGMTVARTDETTEKTELAAWPKLTDENGLNVNYLEQAGEYFEDHFAFRQELVTANSILRAGFLKSPGTEKVITGEDGWLYYTATADDYLGRNTMTERGVYNAAHNLALVQEYVEGQGKKFLFTIAPNKNSLYPESMPYYYKKVSDENNRIKLEAKLKEEGINYVDLYQVFEEQDETLYLKRDSHWNNKGAVLAYNTLLEAAGKRHETYENIPFEIKKDYVGDLDSMVYPLAEHPEENYYYEKEQEYAYANQVDSVEDSWIVTQNPQKKGILLMYRDSFGNTLLPLLSNEFKRAFYSKIVPYPLMENVEKYQPTLVIMERVERHLSMLAKQPPVMEGPKRAGLSQGEAANTKTLLFQGETDNYYLLYGKLDENFAKEDSRIFIKIKSGEGQECTYEAFPVTAVINGEESDYGYQLYVKKENLPSADLEVQVLVQNEEELLMVKEEKVSFGKTDTEE